MYFLSAFFHNHMIESVDGFYEREINVPHVTQTSRRLKHLRVTQTIMKFFFYKIAGSGIWRKPTTCKKHEEINLQNPVWSRHLLVKRSKWMRDAFLAGIFLPSSVVRSTTPADTRTSTREKRRHHPINVPEEARQCFGSLSSSYPWDSLIPKKKSNTSDGYRYTVAWDNSFV